MTARKYRCPIYMERSTALIAKWRELESDYRRDDDYGRADAYHRAAAKLEAALYQDQHDLFHDGEFHDGCDICDDERLRYG